MCCQLRVTTRLLVSLNSVVKYVNPTRAVKKSWYGTTEIGNVPAGHRNKYKCFWIFFPI